MCNMLELTMFSISYSIVSHVYFVTVCVCCCAWYMFVYLALHCSNKHMIISCSVLLSCARQIPSGQWTFLFLILILTLTLFISLFCCSIVYIKLFNELGWKQVALLAEDGQEFPEYHTYLQDLFQAEGIQVVFHRKMPRDAGMEDTHKVCTQLYCGTGAAL